VKKIDNHYTDLKHAHTYGREVNACFYVAAKQICKVHVSVFILRDWFAL